MHASLDQLLSLRDGAPVDAAVREHAQHCATCLAESVRLAQMRSRLQSLPALNAPSHAWESIEARAGQAPRRPYLRALTAALVVLVVGSIAVVGLQNSDTQPDSVAHTPASPMQTGPSVAAKSDVERLMAQSRKLEELLAYLPERPQVERVSTAATVDSIEQRIQWLDWQLAYESDAGLNARQAERLWSERVELMDSLLKVRYAESAPMVF
jgi:hypothetical protein